MISYTAVLGMYAARSPVNETECWTQNNNQEPGRLRDVVREWSISHTYEEVLKLRFDIY